MASDPNGWVLAIGVRGPYTQVSALESAFRSRNWSAGFWPLGFRGPYTQVSALESAFRSRQQLQKAALLRARIFCNQSVRS